ncbi:MAG: HisA/HisF-related TIM barrel protein [Candidatus Kryptonium sp.]|nr:HisA/HisF-related TIM barrel protein [Candidatus Kryptonium sp.]
MILVIPTIEIKSGKCARIIQGLPESPKSYPDDPVEVAKIWRKENAKTLYVVDTDAKISGKLQNLETIKKIVDAVDIPIMLSGGLKDYENIKLAIDCGALRIALDAVILKTPKLLKEIVNELSSTRIALLIEAKNGYVADFNLSAIEIAKEVMEFGIERIIYHDVNEDETLNFEALKNLAEKTNIKITAEGELNGYNDLKKLMEFESWGIDSIILSKSLYYNKFPCQQLWRVIETEVDL